MVSRPWTVSVLVCGPSTAGISMRIFAAATPATPAATPATPAATAATTATTPATAAAHRRRGLRGA
jgi:hypothetical protein